MEKLNLNNHRKRKVLAITGIRSEYDILYPILRLLDQDSDFDLRLVVCGAHLSDWHGNSLKKIKDDKFSIADKIDYLLMTNRKTQRSKGVGVLISSLTQTVERENPDFIVFVGDREESIAASIVANYMDVISVHIGGGDAVYGNTDDQIRFACTELSHIHCTTSKKYAENLISLGEEPERVFFTGNPALTNIKNTPHIDKESISKELDISLDDFIVFLKHPLSSSKENSFSQMEITINSTISFLEKNNLIGIGIYPNTDPGSYDIIKAINKNQSDRLKFFKTLPRDIFVNLMRHSKALIGNSSMGLLEAPFYKMPVVNVGERQKGRLNAGNVNFVGYDETQIIEGLNKAVFDEEYRSKVSNIDNLFGDGSADKKILEIIRGIDLDDKSWLIKKKLFRED